MMETMIRLLRLENITWRGLSFVIGAGKPIEDSPSTTTKSFRRSGIRYKESTWVTEYSEGGGPEKL